MKKCKLFCIPYAGGSSTIYFRWRKMVDESIDLIPLELPGRGTRRNEPFYKTFEEAVYDLYHIVESQVNADDNFALFGHSMGSWLAFEINHLLQKHQNKLPSQLILSGRWAPNIQKPNQIDLQLPEKDFLKQIYELGGTPKEVLENEQLRSIFIPIFREDLRLLENYKFMDNREILSSNFSVYTGVHDGYITQRDLFEWSTLTNGITKVYKFRGDHFFINSSIEMVTRQISRCLSES